MHARSGSSRRNPSPLPLRDGRLPPTGPRCVRHSCKRARIAPIYPATSDRVPPRVHRLDSLQRSIALDIESKDSVRATSDAVAVRSAWRAIRSNAASVVSSTSADRYDRAIGTVDDPIGSRKASRARLALRNADRDLAAIENGYDHQEAPWRRFIGSHLGV